MLEDGLFDPSVRALDLLNLAFSLSKVVYLALTRARDALMVTNGTFNN